MGEGVGVDVGVDVDGDFLYLNLFIIIWYILQATCIYECKNLYKPILLFIVFNNSRKLETSPHENQNTHTKDDLQNFTYGTNFMALFGIKISGFLFSGYKFLITSTYRSLALDSLVFFMCGY